MQRTMPFGKYGLYLAERVLVRLPAVLRRCWTRSNSLSETIGACRPGNNVPRCLTFPVKNGLCSNHLTEAAVKGVVR